jgi:tetratricopeptide (TPR) repeat protein
MLQLLFTTGVFAGWIASVCLHEFGHAIVAYWGGDKSVKDKGYLTLNPLKYTDVQLSLVFPLIFLLLGGIPLPGAAVYINEQQLRNRGWKSAVSAAGPLATIVCALILAIVFKPLWINLQGTYSQSDLYSILNYQSTEQSGQFWLTAAVAFLLQLQIAAAVLNLLPIPPLDGYGILRPWLTPNWQTKLNQVSRYGFLVLFALLWISPQANHFFWSIVDQGMVLILGDQARSAQFLTFIGYSLFQQGSKVLLLGLIIILVIVGQINKRRIPSSPLPTPGSQFPTAATPETQQRSFATLAKPLAELTTAELTRILAALEQTIAANPDNFQALYYQILVLQYLQREDEAITQFDTLLAQQGLDVELLPKFWHEKGLLLSQQGRYEEAIGAFQKAVAVDPKFAAAWYEQGVVALVTEDYQGAIARFDRVIDLLPEFSYAPHRKGLALFHLQQLQASLVAFDQALLLQPRFIEAWIDRGLTLFQMEAYDRAIAAFDQALDCFPCEIDRHSLQEASTYYNKACCFAKQGKIEGSLELLKVALSLGYRELQHLAQTDPDLAPLQSHPLFSQLLASYD